MLTKATDLSVVLPDEPGTLAKATEATSKAGINIDGFCGPSEDGETFHFLFIKDPAGARRALEGAGFKVKKEQEVVLVDVEDRPGTATAEFKKIAQQMLNVDLVYLATNNRMVIGGEKIEAIREALSAEPAKARS